MLTIERVDRIGLAVPDLEAARAFFEGVLGGRFGELEDVADQGFKYVPFEVAGFTFELLCPYRDDSQIARFLARRGPGVHHVSFQVEKLERAIEELAELDISPAHVHEYPPEVTFEGHQWREAFIHPRHAFGVLIHIAEKTRRA